MSHVKQYYLNGLSLKVNKSAYLVEIEMNHDNTEYKLEASDLPDWIFGSRHAIWLTADNLSIFDRAKRGDQIRKQLMKARASDTSDGERSSIRSHSTVIVSAPKSTIHIVL